MDTIEMRSTGLLSRLPSRLHHNAFVVRDHEINRRFFEELLGIPLVATWCEKNFSSELQREVEFCHTFFGMADGSALAFFQFADPELYEMTQAEKPARVGRYDHIAFKAEPETYDELKQRLNRAGEKYRETNHGYCKSIYVSSPDGLIVEFTQDPEDVLRQVRTLDPRAALLYHVPAAHQNPHDDLVRLLRHVVREHRDGRALGVGRHGASDAVLFLERGIPCVEFGPAGAGHHGPDEHVDIGSLQTYRRILVGFAHALAGSGPG